MHVVRFRLLLLVLLLLGATISISLNFEDDADILVWQGQAQTLRVDPQEKAPSRLLQPSSSSRRPRINSENTFRSRLSVIDLVSVLRC
jgi:hypothetical protein